MSSKQIVSLTAILLLLTPTLTPARAADPAGSIVGVVTGADGKPAAIRDINLYAAVRPDQPPDPKVKAPKPVATVKTNDKGEYVLANIPPGTYRLIAGVPFVEMAVANVTVKAGQKVTQNLTLKARRRGF